MAIEKIEAFIGECDNCKDVFDDGQFSIFTEESTVKGSMQDSEWYTGDTDPDHVGKYYCPACFKLHEEIDDGIIIEAARTNLHAVTPQPPTHE